MDPRIKDYGTTIAFFLVAAALTYQAQIMAQVPPQYGLLALIAFGALSQFATNSRVKDEVAKGNDVIDAGQAKLDEYRARIADLEAQLDAKQAEIEAMLNSSGDSESAVQV